MEESKSATETLTIDLDRLEKKYGPGAIDVGETILRLQALLLSLIDREILDPNNIETINNFLSRMLFGQQEPSADLFTLVARFIESTGKLIIQAEPNKQRRAIYGKSGLGFSACRALYDQANEYWDSYGREHFSEVTNHITADFIEALGNFVFSLPEIKPATVKIPHTKPARSLSISHGRILSDWIVQQAKLADIRSSYFGEIEDIAESTEICANYLKEAFEYNAPWVLSAFYIFVSKIAETEADHFTDSPLAQQLSMLPAYAKFGVNTPAAAFFSMIGVNARDASIILADQFNEQNPSSQFDFIRMVNWLLDLEPEQTTRWFETSISITDSSGHIPRLFRFLDSIRQQEQSLDEILPLELEIAGWKHYRGPSLISELHVGDDLQLNADPMNPWDNYAVEVYDGRRNKLGFIPRSHSRAVNLHLAGGLPLSCKISSIDLALAFRPVKITGLTQKGLRRDII